MHSAANTSMPIFALGMWARTNGKRPALLAISLVALSGGITGCDSDKVERFKRFCAERSTVKVADPAAWRDYVRLVRSSEPKIPIPSRYGGPARI